MTLRQSQSLFAQHVAQLLQYIASLGFSVTLGEAWRPKETAQLYAKQGRGIEKSLHCDRLAIDLNIFDPDGNLLTDSKDHQPFGYYWEKLDPKNRWGGSESFVNKAGKRIFDGNHYQRNE